MTDEQKDYIEKRKAGVIRQVTRILRDRGDYLSTDKVYIEKYGFYVAMSEIQEQAVKENDLGGEMQNPLVQLSMCQNQFKEFGKLLKLPPYSRNRFKKEEPKKKPKATITSLRKAK